MADSPGEGSSGAAGGRYGVLELALIARTMIRESCRRPATARSYPPRTTGPPALLLSIRDRKRLPPPFVFGEGHRTLSKLRLTRDHQPTPAPLPGREGELAPRVGDLVIRACDVIPPATARRSLANYLPLSDARRSSPKTSSAKNIYMARLKAPRFVISPLLIFSRKYLSGNGRSRC